MGGRWLIGFGVVLAAFVLFAASVVVINAIRKDVIANGIRIANADVGGLDRKEARELVERDLIGEVPKEVRATYKSESFVLRPEEAHAKLDVDASVDAALSHSRSDSNPFSRLLTGHAASGTVAPRVSVSRAAVVRFVARVGKQVDRRARDADIDWHDGKLERTPARYGVETQRNELVAAVLKRLGSPAPDRDVEVPVKVIERADRTLDDLAKRYPTVIAIERDAKRLRLYKNLRLKHKYLIAVGQAGLETEAGRYEIEDKQVNPAWHVPNSEWAGELAGQTIPPGDPDNPLKAPGWVSSTGRESTGPRRSPRSARAPHTAASECLSRT